MEKNFFRRLNFMSTKETIAFTSAGISKSIGIPTLFNKFESRKKFCNKYFSQNYNYFWEELKNFESQISTKTPSLSHKLISEHDFKVITLNIDNFHTLAGSQNVIEVYGNLHKVYCTCCNNEFPFSEIYKNLYCPLCGNKIKPEFMLHKDNTPECTTAFNLLKPNQCVLFIGTSFNTTFSRLFLYKAQCLRSEIHCFNQNTDKQLVDFLAKF